MGKSIDLLFQSAKQYEKLLDIFYNIEIGRKGVVWKFSITFSKSDFHHIAGLHKLRDVFEAQRGFREDLFNKIINGQITQNDIEISDFYDEIKSRLFYLCYLEKILDDEHLIFKYNENINIFSRIKSDFLIQGTYNNQILYLFLSSRIKNEINNQMCRSFFPKKDKDYSIGQPMYTLLKKQKIRISTSEVLNEYIR